MSYYSKRNKTCLQWWTVTDYDGFFFHPCLLKKCILNINIINDFGEVPALSPNRSTGQHPLHPQPSCSAAEDTSTAATRLQSSGFPRAKTPEFMLYTPPLNCFPLVMSNVIYSLAFRCFWMYLGELPHIFHYIICCCVMTIKPNL